MDPKDLIQRSPLRAFDAALSGGLGKSNLGIVVARHGAGKTPFLVGVALDHLLRGERVLHVSLDQKVEHVREFYEQIFEQLAPGGTLDDARTVHLDMERRRRIHTYLGTSFSIEKLATALSFMGEHASFVPDLIVLDGFDFSNAEPSQLEGIVDLAKGCGAELWMTAVRHREEAVTDVDGIPSPVDTHKMLARVIVELKTIDQRVRVCLLKPKASAKELPVALDPTTMLLTKD